MSGGSAILVIVGLSVVRLGATISKDQPLISWPGAADLLCIAAGIFLLNMAIHQ